MANSRSNIYPVQLQGAELNLNKLDAEIKQYSGFNRNNAPFVGGCLSNIFTKDETIEGATSKNTYIAPNGDVYRVNTEGLWKNGEKLIDYTGKKFYAIEECKTQFPDNIVFVDSEYVYITSRLDPFSSSIIKFSFFLHVYNFFTKSWDEIQIPYSSPTGVGKTSEYWIDAKVFKNNNEILTFVVIKVWGSAYLRVFKTDINGTVRKTAGDKSIGVASISYSNKPVFPVVLQLEVTSENGGIVTVIPNHDSTGTWFCANFSFDLDGQTSSLGYITIGANYRASESKLYKYNTEAGLTEEALVYDYVIHNGEIVLSNPQTVTWGSDYTSAATMIRNLVKPFGFIMYVGKIASNAAQSRKFFGCCDFITQALTLDIQDNEAYYYLYTGAVVGDYVLCNNLTVSGICLPGGTVLVSEWNTVDEKNIYIQKFKQSYSGIFLGDSCDVIYKANDKWIKLKESTPELKVINGQVITNVNYLYNSYSINKNKKLLFAPAWNNRFPTSTSNSHSLTSPIYHIASSINEYKLDDNSSIIINPVPSFFRIHQQASRLTIFTNETDDICVNFYCGTNEIVYEGSLLLANGVIDTTSGLLFFERLYNLPFPSNTDGNIQYSPSLFATEKGKYGNLVFISEGGTAYKLMTYDNKVVMSYFLSSAIEGLQDFFTIQGQLYGILDNQIYNFSIVNEIANRGDFIVSVEGLQFVGNTPYEALFFSKTNRCLYSFTGANVLNAKQFVDKISEVRNYKYNPATQSIFLITDIGVIVYSLFGIYQIEFLNCQDMYLLNNGVILTDNEGTFKYVKYYKEETTDDYTKENIQLETMFYGMNNQTVTINDCLYMRIFSEEHEEGDLEVSATTLSLEGRMTEKTTFRIKERDWDKLTHTIYLRYQPKEQRGLGISFSINSPFKIASLSIGSQADAILIDKVSKGAINAPQRTSNNVEW